MMRGREHERLAEWRRRRKELFYLPGEKQQQQQNLAPTNTSTTEEDEERLAPPKTPEILAAWRPLGTGAYGIVVGVETKERRFAAIKFIFANDTGEKEEALDEAMLHHLLYECHAPSFGPLFGSFWHRPDLTAASLAIPSLLKQAMTASKLDPNGEWYRRMTRTPALVSVMELGMHGTLLALSKNLSDAAQRQIAFQLAWSMSVAEMKLGNEHRDLSSKNVVVAPLAYGPSDHITLFQRFQFHPLPPLVPMLEEEEEEEGGDKMDIDPDSLQKEKEEESTLYWILKLRNSEGTGYIPRIIDFGFGTYADPRVLGRGEKLPHHEYIGLAHHTPPESYFGRRSWCDWRVDLWQLGLILFTCFGMRYNLGLPTTYSDLVDEMGRVSEESSKRVNELQERFVKEALLAENVLSDILEVEQMDEWKTYVLDAPGDRSGRYHRYLMIACLQEHLGNDWRPPATSSSLEGQLYDNRFARTLHHPHVTTWFHTHIRSVNAIPFQQARYYTSRLDAGQYNLLQSLLQWDPEKRIHGRALLQHPVFECFRTRTFGEGMSTTTGAEDMTQKTVVRQAFYECHEREPLVAGKTMVPAEHAQLIRTSQNHFVQAVHRRGDARTLNQVETQILSIIQEQPLAHVT
jgi:serine/threonine protein kinase